MYQQNPRQDSTMLEWESTFFDGIMYKKRDPVKKRYSVVSLDPSKGGQGSKKGDFAALLHVVYDEEGTIWVEDSIMARTSTENLEDYVIEFMQKFKPNAVIIEANSFQSVMASNVQMKANAKKIPIKIYKHVNTQNKESRIRHGLTHLLSKKRIRLRDTPSNRIGLQQLQDFPATFDDFPDSLELATQLIGKLSKIRRKPIENVRLTA